ncbi:IS3 family transposase [Kitasatospora sp. NPDC004669]|uniref:IS3 family transposase n=1 Tax=Kitasatospora sp. NPDC004669 TaxID=3154555 RepID=UPI0033AB50D9
MSGRELHGRTFTTRVEANPALFEYIDGFNNSRHIQEKLGRLILIRSEEMTKYLDRVMAKWGNLNPSTHSDQLKHPPERRAGPCSIRVASRSDTPKCSSDGCPSPPNGPGAPVAGYQT